MARIKGMTVRLINKVETGERDAFNHPVCREEAVDVQNVLIGEPTSEEILNTLNLTGKKAHYVLAIPKGDTHDWEDAEVEFFGRGWETIGIPMQGMTENIPLDWDKKVQVTRYEQD